MEHRLYIIKERRIVFLPIGRRFIIATVFSLMFATLLQSQSPRLMTISGSVVDDSTGKPLENVNVFVAQTTLGCSTGPEGTFEINNIPTGPQDIVASRLGYGVSTVRLSLPSGTFPLEIRLRPVVIPYGEIVVTAPPAKEWRKQLYRFRTLFLGRSPNAKECVIVNPEVLDFEEDDDFFSATARAPLIIDNNALGYRITFLLRVFRTEPLTVVFGGVIGKGYAIAYDGSPQYFQLEPYTTERRDLWKKNRRETFNGSQRHFLAALYRGSWQEEGFLVNLMPEPNIHNTPINRKELTPGIVDLILSPVNSKGEKSLHYEGVLEVEYTRQNLDRSIDVLRKQGTDSPVSWMQLNYESITFDSFGFVKESMPTMVYGYWTWPRFADKLPLNYEPE